MIKVLISVLTYNGNEKTIRTIDDILSQNINKDLFEASLVVIDNKSTNDIYKKIKQKFQDVKIIQSSENNGFSGGNNIAINLALKDNIDLLFILNDDIQLNPNYIQDMVYGYLQITSPVAAIGSTIRLLNNTVQAVSGKIKWWTGTVIWDQKINSTLNTGPRPVDVIQGSAFALTKLAIKSGFKFDEQLFFGGEEYDLGCWSKRHNMEIFVLENIEVIHDTNQAKIICDRWAPDPLNYYYAVRNSIYVTKKYSNSHAKLTIPLFYFIGRSLSKAIIFLAKGEYKTFIFILKSAFDGICEKMGKKTN